MTACERYFYGLVTGEALDCYEVSTEPTPAAPPDGAERATSDQALRRAEEIYDLSCASIRIALSAYARIWMASAANALIDAGSQPDAQNFLRRKLEAPTPPPAALQGAARDLFDAPPPSDAQTDGAARIARFAFDEANRPYLHTEPQAAIAPLLRPEEIGALRAATYPFFALKPRFMDGADLFDPSMDVRLSSYFGIDVTKPGLFRKRIAEGLALLLRPTVAGDPTRAHFEPPRVFVGRSLTYIPLTYAASDAEISAALSAAFDASNLGAEALKAAQTLGLVRGGLQETEWSRRYRDRALRQSRSDLKYVFPYPDLLDIDDRYVDGAYRGGGLDSAAYRFLPSTVQAEISSVQEQFRLRGKAVGKDDRARGGRAEPEPIEAPSTREVSKPLATFDAKRVDYALSRLEHYTGTNVAHFQPYIFFTNYGFYVETFIRELYETRVRKGAGKLYAPLDVRRLGLPPSETLDFAIDADLPAALHNLGDPAALNLTAATTFAPKQMPAVHYAPNDPSEPGVTMINIGVGPSNAKTITDMLAVLGPKAWLMLGHCGGLRRTQELGQFVLAHAYVRDDHVLDKALPPDLPVPQVIEVQECLMRGIEEALLDDDADPETGDQRFTAYREYKQEVLSLLAALGVSLPDPTRLQFTPETANSPEELAAHPLLRAAGLVAGSAQRQIDPARADAIVAAYKAWRREMRARVRTGSIVTTDDRNWELRPLDEIIDRFERSKAIAVDMESATIAAAGLRYRVPYGALLCVSDKPLMGEPKMRAQADAFYETSTRNHVRIGLRTVDHLFARRDEISRSRKLNGLDDPPLM